MNKNRAQEIIESPSMINVKYNGIPVYIQEVNANSDTATVFPLDETDNSQQVELKELVEEGP